MSRLTRFTAKIFGTGSGTNQMAEFGSLAAGTPARYNGANITPSIVQSLSQYVSGWVSAVIGLNSPTIEDMNGLCYLFSYQIAQILQTGIAEYDPSTTYFVQNIVNYQGILYISIVDNNTNNTPLGDTAHWKNLGAEILSAKFTLEDAVVLYTNISGPHYHSSDQSLKNVAISMFNSGTSGQVTIRINQYRAGAFVASATASLAASGGLPATGFPALSSTLNILAGDLSTCDVIEIPEAAESLSVEIFGGGMAGGGGGGGGAGHAPYVYILTPTDITNKGITLSYTPADPSRILVTIQEGAVQFPGIDYIVGAPNAANFLSWDTLGMQSIVISGMKLLIVEST